MHRYSFALAMAAGFAVQVGCGSSPGAASPHAEGQRPEGRVESAPESAGTEHIAERTAPACKDGTCFRCGENYCPDGFYCDETAPGGPACGWLPSCDKTACTCLTRAFPTCGCEQQNGGAVLHCD